MSIVLLERDGRLSIDDEVHKYLPELPRYDSPITLRNLLQPGPEGVQYVLGKATIRRDAEGNIVGAKARSMSEAEQIAKG